MIITPTFSFGHQFSIRNPNTKIIIVLTRTDIIPTKITLEEIEQFKNENGIKEAPVIKTCAQNQKREGVDELRQSILALSLIEDQRKIQVFSKKVEATIEAIKQLKTDKYNPDDSSTYQVLSN